MYSYIGFAIFSLVLNLRFFLMKGSAVFKEATLWRVS